MQISLICAIKNLTLFFLQLLVNKFYNLYQSLSLAQMLARWCHWCGRKPEYPEKTICPIGQQPYLVTYHHCRSQGSSPCRNDDKRVHCPLCHLDINISYTMKVLGFMNQSSLYSFENFKKIYFSMTSRFRFNSFLEC